MDDSLWQKRSSPKLKPSDAALDELWGHVEGNFDQNAAHDAFLAACVESGQLAFAASKYREMEQRCAEAGKEAAAETARLQLQRLVGAAFSLLENRRTAPLETRRLTTILAAIVSGSLLLACLYAMSQ